MRSFTFAVSSSEASRACALVPQTCHCLHTGSAIFTWVDETFVIGSYNKNASMNFALLNISYPFYILYVPVLSLYITVYPCFSLYVHCPTKHFLFFYFTYYHSLSLYILQHTCTHIDHYPSLYNDHCLGMGLDCNLVCSLEEVKIHFIIFFGMCRIWIPYR